MNETSHFLFVPSTKNGVSHSHFYDTARSEWVSFYNGILKKPLFSVSCNLNEHLIVREDEIICNIEYLPLSP